METQGKENPLLLPVLDTLTSLYVKQWAFGSAIRTSWRACHIREQKFGPASLETAVGLNKLATLYLDSVRLLPQSPSDRFIPAAPAKGSLPATNPGAEFKDLSASFENVTALDDATKLVIAESLFDSVLEVEEKAYGDENTRLVDVLENLGEVLHAEGKAVAAEEAYTRTIAIVEKSLGPDDLRLDMPLQALAELRTEDGNYAEAEKLYQRALRIDESRVGATDPSVGAVLTGYAALLEKMNRSEEARNLTDRANSLAAPRTLKNAGLSLGACVPYILRFEKSISDQYTGIQQTCMLIRADGRIRVEERQQERPGPVSVPQLRVPDGMADMTGWGQQETLNGSSHTGPHAPKTFESSLDANALQQLRAILSAREIRAIRGSYAPRGEANSSNTEKISASILRDDGVQSFAFPDTSARQPYEGELKPLFKWLSTAEKHKGSAIKGVVANDYSPDTPKAMPIQFSVSMEKPSPNADTVATVTAANQHPNDVSQDNISTLKIHVNLVLVRVVVRDLQGRARGTLRQEDFRLLDNGKQQAITRFSLEQPGVKTTVDSKASNETPGVAAGESARASAAAERSVAYLFDDIHLNATDWEQVRRAADRHLSSLHPAVRVAIFTTSGQTAMDFTDDFTKLHETLFRIHPRQVAGDDCPAIDTYMADLIRNKHDEDALDAAAANALVCAYGNDPRFAGAAESLAKATAQQQLASAEAEGQIILRAVQNALRRLRAAAGQQTLVLVSSGFVVPGHEQEFGELIDQALHSDIVINVLDARGLDGVDSFAQSTTSTLQYRRESAGASEEIMATLANSTGGTLFHNSNDLTAGFSRVTEPPEYCYLLGFLAARPGVGRALSQPVGDIEGWREINVTGAEGILCSETVVC